VYSSGSAAVPGAPPGEVPAETEVRATGPGPGVCVPWEVKRRELAQISGDADIVRSVWQDIDGLGNMFAWHCLLSF
jgi:hypothetical protein